jgi:hypothetical protein
MNTWMQSQHLKTVVLEVYKPSDNSLVGRWDIDISYGWSGDDGRFWVDTDQIATAIRKAGILAASCEYSILFITSPGRPDVYGWGDGSLRSTSGFVKQSLGGTVEHSGLGGNASYYRKAT